MDTASQKLSKTCIDTVIAILQSTRGITSKAKIEEAKELSRRTDIVIKQVDKGGALVLLDRTAYINEGLHQLSDEKYYKKTRSANIHG